jgi:ligand-binding sensor domain-containing protein/signal transduction histidine kinase
MKIKSQVKWITWRTGLLAMVMTALSLTGCRPVAGPAPDLATATAVPTETSSLVGTSAAFHEPAANIRFVHVNAEEGLSQSSVHCIVQDRQGFMWFGTEDGLNRYDGYEFVVYRPEPDNPASISDRWINALYEDSKGYLWIGSRQGGLNRYDPTTDQFTRYINDSARPNSIASDYVTVIFEDKHGWLWVGTLEGLDRYSSTTDSFEHFSLNTSPRQEEYSYSITDIFEDSYGNLWIGTADTGLYHYDRDLGKFFNYINEPERSTSLSSNTIRAIRQNTSGELWVATDKGLNLFDPKLNVAIRYQHTNTDPNSLLSDLIHTLYVDQAGNLWIGTSAGLDRFQSSTRRFIHYRHNPNLESSLSSDVVTFIFESVDNVLWVGTFGGGLNKYYRGQDRFSYYANQPGNPYSLSGNVIFKIHADSEEKVWISIFGSGVDCLNTQTGKAFHYLFDPTNPSGIVSNEVWGVYTDRQDTLWVGSSLGLDRLDHSASEFIHYINDPANPHSITAGAVYDMVEDARGNLWIGTDYGVSYFDRTTNTFKQYQHDSLQPNSLSGYGVIALYIDQSGNLWAGTTDDGLNRFDPSTGGFVHYRYYPQIATSISNNYILSIFQDSRGILWVGTFGGGLNRYDPATDSFTHYAETDGLPSNVVYGMVEDNYGYLWLATNNGISRFSPTVGIFRNYSARDGLQGNEFDMSAFARDPQGNLYFGGVNGLTAFNPIAVVDSTYVPPVVVTSITQNGSPVNSNVSPEAVKEMTLRWPNNNFEFEFAALSYALPERNQYAYKLENFDDSWNIIGSLRDGRYTNLPGGTYTLRVKGSNQDGVWNYNGGSIKVTVIPPFWQTTWFIVTASVATLGLLFSGYWIRIKSVQAYNRELERQVRDRTREIERLFEKTKELAVVEERNRLARELHDSAKQKAFAALAQLGTASEIVASNSRAAKNHVSEAENLVYEVIEDLTFLIQEMYPLALKEKGLETTLREYIFEWESRTDIQVSVRIQGYRRLKLEVEQAMYRIIQEALSNVARHSGATHVDVFLICDEDTIEAVVSDNGCGFNQRARPAGIGLRSIQERAESLGGTVNIESESNCGTRLTARVPLIPRNKNGEGVSNA